MEEGGPLPDPPQSPAAVASTISWGAGGGARSRSRKPASNNYFLHTVSGVINLDLTLEQVLPLIISLGHLSSLNQVCLRPLLVHNSTIKEGTVV